MSNQKTLTPQAFHQNEEGKKDVMGEHPTELGALDGMAVGLGAVMGGVVSGAAIGMVAGPVGAVAGAAVGAVAGGIAGQGLGKMIDPTAEDDWLRNEFSRKPYVKPGQTFEEYTPLYRFGGQSEARNSERSFEDAELDVKREYEKSDNGKSLPWREAKQAVADAFNRSRQLRNQQLKQN